MKKLSALILCILFVLTLFSQEITLKAKKKYLNIPISHKEESAKMSFSVENEQDLSVDIRLASDTPDYWVFKDISNLKGKTIKISYTGNRKGLDKIYQDNEIAGRDSLYKEKNRPQIHFSTRRGWINDPNGLVYYAGEYHLFYQHNPYEIFWGNMHWGHAVSKDLIHWEELPIALYPDKFGTVFSGSVVIDHENTSGFGSRETPPMVAVYTASSSHKQVQCLAYSVDKGRTWKKYDTNPVLDTKHIWNHEATRDPKVFWHKPDRNWVMVLFELDGLSIYTSKDLKKWDYQSHTVGFWECPELFELPVDGNKEKTKWVMYGASGTYMIGTFDGKTFTPEAGKYYYTQGSAYAAQTFNNIPASDERRLQIAWGRITHKGMPFNGQMLIPTALTLKNTKDGVRLFSNPIKEIEKLHKNTLIWHSLTAKEATDKLNTLKDWDCLRLKIKMNPKLYYKIGLKLDKKDIIFYDMNFNLVNGVFYSPDDMVGKGIFADIFIDRTSVEVFVDRGAYSYSFERKISGSESEKIFEFVGEGLMIDELIVHELESVW